ncbi:MULTISPECIES: hypothetical protein [Bacillus]|uniref:Lactococcin 972 family bacteriocin n=1 Tax=Bacillus halotolerans TaxID=260554 RepID=A0ABY7I078_9BACI|nr:MULTISPECIES: hypothetical protein [Bacillus]MCC8354538.1 hypothetical protein [Bacillus sp. AF23]MCY8208549.1 hypothetical protein [Bacillus subtilis]MDG0764322.1 hypothetical protein [Bacillus halotolerans]MED3628544.1 hypothetical protein [Bacillus subtilis]UUI84286.1 hypothetical protein NPA28_20225 [Bacillus halotolerans]
MKKKILVFMLILGVSFTSLGTAKLLAKHPPDGNFVDTKFHFGFLKGNPYDETTERQKYRTTYVYQNVKDVNIAYTSWVKASGHDASHGHNYTVRNKGVVLMTNYAVEDYRSWWAESVSTSIAAKKNGNGHSNGVWSPDYDKYS